MSMVSEKTVEHIGETKGIEDHDHDLVHDLSKRLDSLWRYDQYIANAEGHKELEEFWKEIKRQEQHTIGRLKNLIHKEVSLGCF